MLYHLLADVVVLLHVFFVLFVILGGALVLRWRTLAWIHLPAVLWAALIEFANWICPLTPLENRFRRLAGAAGYEGGFVEHYLLPLLYPAQLTRGVQIFLGVLVILLNVAAYSWILRSGSRNSR